MFIIHFKISFLHFKQEQKKLIEKLKDVQKFLTLTLFNKILKTLLINDYYL